MTIEELLDLLRGEADPDRRQAIVDQAMESLTPQNLERFVTEAGDELTPQQRDRIQTFREQQPGQVEQAITDQVEGSQFLEDEAQREAASAADSMFDAANADGTITTEEADAIQQATGEDRRPDGTPPWMLDANGASYWSEDQKQRLVDYVNFYQGGAFRSFDDLIESGYLNEPTALNQQTVQAAILDDEPFQTLSVSMPGGDMFTVEAREWESAQGMYGVDSRDLTKIVRVANQVGAMDTTGKPAWQLMTALMKATGMLDTVLDFKAGGPGTPAAIFRIGRPLSAGGVSTGGDQPLTGRRPGRTDRLGTTDPAPPDPVGQEITDEKPLGFDEAGIPVSRFARPMTAAELSYSINEGMRLYEDSMAMAYIHVLDPQLAAKIKMGARTPGMFTRADQNKLFDLVALSGAPTTEDFRTQLILQGEARLQGDSNDLYGNYLDYLLGTGDGGDGGRGGGGGAQVIKSRPDPASLDERLRELYQTMFFTEPDDETLARFRSQINSAIDAAGPGDQVDWGARAAQFARNDPRYADLYGNMPDTLSEGDYRMQFEAGQASMLGAERAGNAAVMAGMRDGNFQTTVGAAAGTTEAWDNSVFLDRLARASRAVSEMT